MTAEQGILFACTRQEFLPEHRRAVEEACAARPIDWAFVAAAAARGGVAPVVGANLRRSDARSLGCPPEIEERLGHAALENAAHKEREALELLPILSRLAEAGLQIMLLKGIALDALVYAGPWVTTARDIDLLVRPQPGRGLGDDAELALRAARATGIECGLREQHDLTMNGILPIRFDEVWRDSVPLRFRGIDAFAMGPEDLVISLCINSARKRYFRLKSLFDLAETCRRFRHLDWDRLGGKAQRYGCAPIVLTALLAADATVGCPVAPGLAGTLGLGRARERAIRRSVAYAARRPVLRPHGTRASEGSGAVLALGLILAYASLSPAQALRSVQAAVQHRLHSARPQSRAAVALPGEWPSDQ